MVYNCFGEITAIMAKRLLLTLFMENSAMDSSDLNAWLVFLDVNYLGSPRINLSLGGQGGGYPLGYKPVIFVFDGGVK